MTGAPTRRLAAAILAWVAFAACSGSEPPLASCIKRPLTTDSGIEVQDLTCGRGAIAERGATLTLHYLGRLETGESFDTAYSKKRTFPVALGAGQVIQGLDEGLEGMREKGTRRLVIPPELAYGEDGAAPLIPPNATLTYDVELVDVTRHD